MAHICTFIAMQTLTENITISLNSNNNSSAFPVKEQSAFF